MRIARIIASLLLLLPVAVSGQVPGRSGTGHFENWLSGPEWGADKQTFEIAFGFQRRAATFAVAEQGFGWRLDFTSCGDALRSWGDVTAWCSSPDAVLFRTRENRPPVAGIYDLKPDDLGTIVNRYFKKSVPDVEWSGPGWECTEAGLNRPNPADRSKILELLETASPSNSFCRG